MPATVRDEAALTQPTSINSSPLTSPGQTPPDPDRRPKRKSQGHPDTDPSYQPAETDLAQVGHRYPQRVEVVGNGASASPTSIPANEDAGEIAAGLLWGCSNPPTSAELMRIYGTRPLRAQFACDYCRRRKAKCSGTEPCTRCVAKKRECVFSTVRNQRKVTVSLKDIRGIRSPQKAASDGSRRPSTDCVSSVSDREPTSGRRVVASQSSVGATTAELYQRMGKLDRPPRHHVYSSQSTPNLSTGAQSDRSPAWTLASPGYPDTYGAYPAGQFQAAQQAAQGWQGDYKQWDTPVYGADGVVEGRAEYGLGLHLDPAYSMFAPANQYSDPSTWHTMAIPAPMPAPGGVSSSTSLYPAGSTASEQLALNSSGHFSNPAGQSQPRYHSQYFTRFPQPEHSQTYEHHGSHVWPVEATSHQPVTAEADSAAPYESPEESLGFRPPTP
ncbi:unnamed protein product [Parajaminaea phylloscopi]